MASNNKVLTVSCGTFYCSLLRFIDSFEMMKISSEYFKKLTQEDLFFGAEPPTVLKSTMRECTRSRVLSGVSAGTVGTEVVLTKTSVSEPKVG